MNFDAVSEGSELVPFFSIESLIKKYYCAFKKDYGHVLIDYVENPNLHDILIEKFIRIAKADELWLLLSGKKNVAEIPNKTALATFALLKLKARGFYILQHYRLPSIIVFSDPQTKIINTHLRRLFNTYRKRIKQQTGIDIITEKPSDHLILIRKHLGEKQLNTLHKWEGRLWQKPIELVEWYLTQHKKDFPLNRLFLDANVVGDISNPHHLRILKREALLYMQARQQIRMIIGKVEAKSMNEKRREMRKVIKK